MSNQMSRKVLPLKFFNRPTLAVAEDLLGKYIVRRYRGREITLMITETEAYDGPLDRASHASRGRTPRNLIMFGPAGRFYVYFTYGMHWLVNIITGPREYPAAVLFRAGIYTDKRTGNEIIVKGPARLTKFLHIDGVLNGTVALRGGSLWIEERTAQRGSNGKAGSAKKGAGKSNGANARTNAGIKNPLKIKKSRRVGVDYAGPAWAGKLYNFSIK